MHFFFQGYSSLVSAFLSTAKDCGTLDVPLNGSINEHETTFPNEATFSCDEGFLLNGSTVRRCQADGSWSGINTSCEGKIYNSRKQVTISYPKCAFVDDTKNYTGKLVSLVILHADSE